MNKLKHHKIYICRKINRINTLYVILVSDIILLVFGCICIGNRKKKPKKVKKKSGYLNEWVGVSYVNDK